MTIWKCVTYQLSENQIGGFWFPIFSSRIGCFSQILAGCGFAKKHLRMFEKFQQFFSEHLCICQCLSSNFQFHSISASGKKVDNTWTFSVRLRFFGTWQHVIEKVNFVEKDITKLKFVKNRALNELFDFKSKQPWVQNHEQ